MRFTNIFAVFAVFAISAVTAAPAAGVADAVATINVDTATVPDIETVAASPPVDYKEVVEEAAATAAAAAPIDAAAFESAELEKLEFVSYDGVLDDYIPWRQPSRTQQWLDWLKKPFVNFWNWINEKLGYKKEESSWVPSWESLGLA